MNHFGSIFGPETDNVLQKTHSKSMPKKRGKVMLTRPMSGANAIKWHQKGSPRSPKAHENGTKWMPKRPKIHLNDARGQNNIFLKDFRTDLGDHFCSIFGPTTFKMYNQNALKNRCLKFEEKLC